MKLLKTRLRQWLDDMSVEFLREALEKKLEESYRERAEMFEYGQAQVIQEKRAFNLGQESAWKDILEILDLGNDEILYDYFREDLVDDEGDNEEWLTQVGFTQVETESL